MGLTLMEEKVFPECWCSTHLSLISISTTRKTVRSCVLIPTKCGTGSVGEDEKGKQKGQDESGCGWKSHFYVFQ
jgi:hypothetical protein